MKRNKMHWVINTNAGDGMVKFLLNDELNCLIPEGNELALKNKYFEILVTSQNTNFKCTII
jgi:hypothetical protein